ncbi:Imm1 family immunity protein [Amycolatopsis sp. NPDC058986]|uniref:Imm1 family immunity protein n=1 Tax=unclassified Amycolatopsis TaxID=2618356 RepID=UPI00366CE00B
MKVEAWYDQDADDPTIVTTAAELDAVLDKVAALDGPRLVQLYPADGPDGPELSAGLHGDRGVLRYAGHDAPSGSCSRNTGTPFARPEWGAVRYYYMTSDNDYPDNAEIPAEAVRKAAHEFMTTGARPTSVEWTEEQRLPRF